MVYDTQKMASQNFIYNDKFSNTTAAQTSSGIATGTNNTGASTNFMFSSNTNTSVIMSQTATSTHKSATSAQRKMIMRISKSPYKHSSTG